MVLRLAPCSSRGPALLTPSSARRVGVVANLAPASGRQNHTASPSATASARLTLRRVHRIPPNVRDDRETPLLERRDGDSKSHIFEKQKRFFFEQGTGRPNQLERLEEIALKKIAERWLVSVRGMPHVRETARRANHDEGPATDNLRPASVTPATCVRSATDQQTSATFPASSPWGQLRTSPCDFSLANLNAAATNFGRVDKQAESTSLYQSGIQRRVHDAQGKPYAKSGSPAPSPQTGIGDVRLPAR